MVKKNLVPVLAPCGMPLLAAIKACGTSDIEKMCQCCLVNNGFPRNYRSKSILPTPEEAAKRLSSKGYRGGLLLFNPKGVFWAFDRKHYLLIFDPNTGWTEGF